MEHCQEPWLVNFQKLEQRQDGLSQLTEDDRLDALAVLHLDYMSSDEETEVDGQPTRLVRLLPWESERLRMLKVSLDRGFLLQASPRQQLHLAKNVVKKPTGPVSSRPAPSTAPAWALHHCENNYT